MLRRYWWPIAFSDHVKDRPMKVRLLGQDFVLFRNGQGKVGMLDLHCPHRLTSLEYGRVEEQGLRCCYHGWLFAPDGKCLDTPAERPESNFKDRVRANAYEVEELGGFVFVYIGPKPAPVLPKYDVLVRTDGKRIVGCDEDYCNWLQKAENGADLPHLPFLHASVYPKMAMRTPLGYDYEDTRYGFKCILKMPELPPRIIHFVMPAHSRISTTPRTGMLPSHDMRLRVPIDDTLTYSFWIRFHPLADGTFEQQTLGFTGKTAGRLSARGRRVLEHPVERTGSRRAGDPGRGHRPDHRASRRIRSRHRHAAAPAARGYRRRRRRRRPGLCHARSGR